MRRRIAGFVLSQYLLTLFAGAILMTSMVLSIALGMETIGFDQEVQDEIGVSQLRRMLLVSRNMEVSGNTLLYTYQKKDYRLNMVNGNLIAQPGTQIFLVDVEGVFFYTTGEMVYLHYERKQKSYERCIA